MKDDRIQIEVHQVRFIVKEKGEFLQRLRDFGKTIECSLICINRNSVAGKRHVKAALHFAVRSFKSKMAISRSLEVESLLYTAGTRQTGLIEPFGIKTGVNECYLCIYPPSDKAKKKLLEFIEFVDSENWEEIPKDNIKHLQKLFDITDTELQVAGKNKLADLILERVALLNINR